MDTYYDVENTNTGGMIVNVTEKKGDDTKTFVKKFTRFTEGFDYINKSRFHEAFDALNNLGWLVFTLWRKFICICSKCNF